MDNEIKLCALLKMMEKPVAFIQERILYMYKQMLYVYSMAFFIDGVLNILVQS